MFTPLSVTCLHFADIGPGGASLAGGHNNKIFANVGSIMGGTHNVVEVNSDYGAILGGLSNLVSAPYALAAGRQAMAEHQGAFIWGDSTDDDVQSSAADEFTVRASGGARFFTSPDLSTGVTLSAGGGAWATLSDRDAKRDFEPVDAVAILEKVAELPLTTWRYHAQDTSIRHIGPIAQDFHAAFGFGSDDKRITSVDADGVALAAIQGLNQKLLAREAEIDDLRNQNANVEQRLAVLEQMIASLANRLEAAQ